jgi:hypothetical protein
MLLFEVVVTRLFSVLFFYHFSFFAISLVMSGLVVGGILVSRWNAGGLSERSFAMRLALLSASYSAATGAGVVGLVSAAELDALKTPSLRGVALYALLFLPGLVAAGAFLALAFARNQQWIGKLYAADLVAASSACIVAIVALRVLEGPAVVVVVAGLARWAVFIAPTLTRLAGRAMAPTGTVVICVGGGN